MTICVSCRGKKTILALGNIVKDCEQCHGIGYVGSHENEIETKLGDVIVKTRRRKKKIIDSNENELSC